MDTSQYLSMFLEESMDNLQTLNESLLQLEQEPENLDKLNEIFRVAHTIKGMAATMGFTQMAELTHKMEDVLSKFREGQLKVTEQVVTVLFQCLDILETMVKSISTGIEKELYIEEIIISLEEISKGGLIVKNPIKDKEIAVDKLEIIENDIILNEYDINVLKQAVQKGYNSYKISVTLDSNTLLKSARAFLIFKNLEECGEIIKSVPGVEDLENENFDLVIGIIYISVNDKHQVYDALINVSEVVEVDITNINDDLIKVQTLKEISNSNTVLPSKSDVKISTDNILPKEISKETPAHKKSHQSVRVDLERLDKFMNMVSELVINRTRLEQISINHKLTDLNETLEQVARNTSDLQDLVMKIRMLPLDVVFNRFPRMIRDLSVELDKDMELIVQGQETEIDRTVIDEIGEPLIHLIRNAADHGIESKAERAAKGKSPVGKINLIAYQEGTKAVIRIEDDGKGIDVDRVKAKANKIGINTEGMTDMDIKNLIFGQGFSTNEVVTDISGRGVGMDVVKTKISALGGTVDVISEIDKGTSFIIRLPLTLQIIQALLVKIGTETMAISLGYIDRVIDFKADMIKKTNNKEVIIYRDNIIPFVRLNEKLGLESLNTSKSYIVIVKVGEKVVGLLVDSLLGQQEIVIKSIGKTMLGLKEYIGATILGDGLVTLILDVAALI